MHKLPSSPCPPGELHLTPGSRRTVDVVPRMRESRIFCNSDPTEGSLELNLNFSISMYWAECITGDSPW